MRGEKREAKRDGATLVKNSGRGEMKGDAKLDLNGWKFLVDYKHYSTSFSINKKNWEKMCKDSWNSDHRSPLIKVIFDDGTEVAIIDWADFKELVNGYA